MVTKHRISSPAAFLLLVLALGLILSCQLSQAVVETPETVVATIPRLSPTGEASQLEAAPTIIDEPPQGATAVPTQKVSRPAQGQHNWLHFGVDSQFSSYKPEDSQINKANVGDLKLIYGAGCADGVFSVIGGTPALYRGCVVATYAGRNLEMGNPLNGDLIWGFGELAYGWAPPPVVSTDGVIYYLYVTPDASSKLFAVDFETGQQIWEAATQFRTGFNFDAQPTVDEKNGLIYIIEDKFGDGRLFAVERGTGEVAWVTGEKSQDEGISFVGSIVILYEDKLYVPALVKEGYYKRKHMVRVDPFTQEVDLQYEIPSELSESWGVEWYGFCGGQVLETYTNNSNADTVLVAHPLDDPVITWQSNITRQSARLACDPRQGIVYIPTEKSLLAINAGTGAPIWEFKSISSIYTPTIANGVIYFLSDTNMYALDQANGEKLFRYSIGLNADASTGVAVNDGLVVFSGSGGDCDLYILGLDNPSR